MIPFFLVGLIASELSVRIVLGRQIVPHIQPCIVPDEFTHHRYRAHCSFTFETDYGPVTYQFNAHGLRDKERSAFPSGKKLVAVLGDSIVKGLFLQPLDSLSARLEEMMHGEAAFLNAGIRFTGAVTQAAIFERSVLPNYPVSGVIWVLNDGDPIDERFARAQAIATDENGMPIRFPAIASPPQKDFFNALVALAPYSSAMQILARTWKFQKYRERLQDVPPSEALLCEGIRKLSSLLKKEKIPLLVVFSPHLKEGVRWNWMGEPFAPADTDVMVGCARKAGAGILDLRASPPARELYFEDHMHFRPKGIEWLSEAILKSGLLKPLLKAPSR